VPASQSDADVAVLPGNQPAIVQPAADDDDLIGERLPRHVRANRGGDG
jgi:hypothetical protein